MISPPTGTTATTKTPDMETQPTTAAPTKSQNKINTQSHPFGYHRDGPDEFIQWVDDHMNHAMTTFICVIICVVICYVATYMIIAH